MTTAVEDDLQDLLGERTATDPGPGETADIHGDGPDTDNPTLDAVLALQGELRLILPGHTYFKLFSGQSAPRRVLVGPGGQQFEIPPQPSGVNARWSTPTGMWRVIAAPCEPGLLHYDLKGPGTHIVRGHRTFQKLVDSLRGNEAISA